MAGIVQLNFHIDPELKRRFKRYCLENELTINEVLNSAVRSIVDQGSTDFRLSLTEQKQIKTIQKEKDISSTLANSWESSY